MSGIASEDVVLVDPDDREIGRMEKLEAHQKGVLHRAFSVLIHDGNGWMLLQKRQRAKYHSQSQWTNACCSHPRPGEAVPDAAHRRLREEMGFDCPLNFLFSTVYRSEAGNGLTEHELVHVFVGRYGGIVAPDPEEADGYQWMAFDDVLREISDNPGAFTPWLRIYLASHGEMIGAAMRS